MRFPSLSNKYEVEKETRAFKQGTVLIFMVRYSTRRNQNKMM